jgi:hypothetical protein
MPLAAIYADEGDVVSRLDLFFLNAAEVGELSEFSVAFESKVNSLGQDSYHRSISHQAIRLTPFARRIDNIRVPGIKVAGIMMPIPQHFLETNKREIVAEVVSTDGTFRRTERDIGGAEKFVRFDHLTVRRMNALLSPLAENGAFPDRVETETRRFYERKVIEEKTNSDGTVSVVFLGPDKTFGYEVVFSNDPDFLPISVSARTRKFSKEGPPVAKNGDDFRQWKQHSLTKTSWMKIGTNYVPKRIEFVYGEDGAQLYEQKVLVFSDWKLGKDVDQEQFKPESMTDEKLKQFDAKGLIERLDKAIKEIEDEEKGAAKR